MEAMGSIDTDAAIWGTSAISLGETPDPVQMEIEVRKPLEQRIVKDLTLKNTARHTLDGCLTIEGPTDLYREKIVHAYQEQIKSDSSTLVCCCIGGILSFAAKNDTIAVVCFAAAFFISSRINTAKEQIQFYLTPSYQKPAEQRRLAYLDPFPSLYASRLAWTPSQPKGVLHPNEVEYLYKKYLTQFCDKLLSQTPSRDQEKEAWLAKFFTLNPLSLAMMLGGLEKKFPTLEELHQAYSQLIPEPITYNMLRKKFFTFPGPIGPIGPVGSTGMYLHSAYLHQLESLVVKYEQKFEDLKYGYLRKEYTLKCHYNHQLQKIAPESLPLTFQILNDQYEYDLKRLRDPYIAKTEELKTAYDKDLKEFKTQFVPQKPHHLEEQLEKRWHELQTILTKNTPYNADLYEKARALLERTKKELNPPTEIKTNPCLDVEDLLYYLA